MAINPSGVGAFNLGNVYPNAFFDYLSRLMPRRLKLLFRWLEYLYANCGQVFSCIKKFSEYPVTTLTYDTQDKDAKKKLTETMEKHVHIRSVDIQVGIDYHMYGNSFTSVFKPFTRWLVCKKCSNRHNAVNYPYEWMNQRFEFKIKCSSCGSHDIAKVEHEKLPDPKKIRVVRWDPKDIDINSNPITSECEYYYNIPDSIKQKIRSKKPDKFLLNTLPWEFIETIKAKRVFKFRDGQLYHMKCPSPAGINQEWGFPPLLGCMKPFFYTAILRKSNEAVALERLVPWRVIYPQASSANNDPAAFVTLSRFKTELSDAVRKWRRDPNMVKLSPIPIGMTQIGGDGRNLMVTNEIQQAEEVIVTSMGVPKEFIYGGLTHAGGSVTLRMLENLIFTYVDQLTEFNQWVTDQVCDFANWKRVTVGMTDFKLIDDIQQKQMVGQLFQAKSVSETTFLKSMDIDPEHERKQMVEDAVSQAKMQQEIERRLKEIKSDLSQKVDQQMDGNPLKYDPNAVLQVAQQEAMTCAQMPEEQRKKRLEQLKAQDPVLEIVVQNVLTQIHRQQKQQGATVQTAGAQPQGQPDGAAQASFKVSPEQSGGGSPSTTMGGG